jgi:hypothetical protein
MSHIILLGNLTVGFHAVGPFVSRGDAYDYSERNVAVGYAYIMELFPAEEKNDEDPAQPARPG